MDESLTVDYQAVLADLRAKRERADAAIQAIEALMRPQSPHGRSESQTQTANESASQRTSYQGMSILDASRKVLQDKGQCQRTKEILRALQDGGIALTGKSPINNVGAVLNSNLKRGGGIVRVKRGLWSLASWQAQPASQDQSPSIENKGADARYRAPLQCPTQSTPAAAHA